MSRVVGGEHHVRALFRADLWAFRSAEEAAYVASLGAEAFRRSWRKGGRSSIGASPCRCCVRGRSSGARKAVTGSCHLLLNASPFA